MTLTADYHKYIKSARWRAKCDVYWMRKGKSCKACGVRRDLKVHHLSYDNFGREPLADLVGLCQKHHLQLHREHRRAGRPNLRTFSLQFIARIHRQR